MERTLTALVTREQPCINRQMLYQHDIIVVSKIEDTVGYRFNTVLLTNDSHRNSNLNEILNIIEASNEESVTIIKL